MSEGTRRVEYKDKNGYKFLVEIPAGAAPEMAKHGVVIGPPDLSELGLPKAVEVRLNNALYDRRLFTRRDLKRDDLFAALQGAYRVDVTTLDNLYRKV